MKQTVLSITTFGKRLRWLRIEAELSQRELADKMGFLTAATISNYEKGATHPKSAVIIAFANFFDCKAAFFLDDLSEILGAYKNKKNADFIK